MPSLNVSDSSSEEDYYAAIEKHFVALRGSPLFISPGEWQLIHRWQEKRIPIRVVQEGLDRAFERRKDGRPVRRLSFCRQTVEAAYRRFCEAMTGARREPAEREESNEVQAYLHRLHERLRELSRSAESLRSNIAVAVGKTVSRLAQLESEAWTAERLPELELELEQLEAALMACAEASIGDDERERIRVEAEGSLGGYRRQMPETIYRSALRSAYLKRLRARFSLPPLSLFYL
ncbi:MAG: hypothetical protein ACE5JI_02150 [Acidobacteriota bacterium]